MTTPEQLKKAREWATYTKQMSVASPKSQAAAEIIASLPDQWIDTLALKGFIRGLQSDKNETKMPVGLLMM